MTIKQLIAEIETIFPQYTEAGLIDRIDLSRSAVSALRRFGNNIMIKGEAFVDIKGGRGKLPDDYWHLMVAIKAEPFKYEIIRGEKETLLDSYFFRERTQERNVWNYTLDEYVPEDTTTISEKFVFKRSEVEFKYLPSYPLRLVKGFKRTNCANNSPYQSRQFAVNSPYEINILGDRLQTNFDKGTIYMQYYALPTDEDGDIIVPDTQHDEVRDYILYMLQRKVLERVMLSDDDPNVGNKLSYIRQQEEDARNKAYTETKMEAIRDWRKDFIRHKRLQTQAYDRLLPNR